MRTVTSRNLIVNSRLRVSKEKLTCQIRTWQYEQSWAAGAGRKRVRLMCTEMLVVCIWQFQISPSVWCATAGSFKLTDRFEFAGLCPELLYLSVRCWIFSWYGPWRVWWISVTKAGWFYCPWLPIWWTSAAKAGWSHYPWPIWWAIFLYSLWPIWWTNAAKAR